MQQVVRFQILHYKHRYQVGKNDIINNKNLKDISPQMLAELEMSLKFLLSMPFMFITEVQEMNYIIYWAKNIDIR